MKKIYSAKNIFITAFILLSLVMLMLPFAATFNEFLTRIVQNFAWYKLLQSYAVPYTAHILYQILSHLPGLVVKPIPRGIVVNGTDVLVNWNCLGWQSYLLFIASLFVGLRGSNFSKKSIALAIIFGLSGTFIINILRMVFTAALVGWWRGLYVILFHNYLATFIGIVWLFFFWWFSYNFLLEEK